jgi:hypothetical protein
MWIYILFGFLAGFFKAIRDTVKDHWPRAIFNQLPEPWCAWFRSDWQDKRLPYPLTDAWHLADFLSYICTGVFLRHWHLLTSIDYFVQIAIIFLLFFVTMTITFQLFYHKILVRIYEKIYTRFFMEA